MQEALQQTDKIEAQAALPQRSPRLPSTTPTVASSFIFVTLCTAIVLSALAYGTVHYWALAVFEFGAALTVCMWCADALSSGNFRINRSVLQLPLIGLVIVGLFQLLPFGTPTIDSSALSLAPLQALSLDPYSTRLVLLQLGALIIYFAAALAFTDSPARLRALVRTIIIFGFILAVLGLIQSFTSPTKIYWFRDLPQSTPFGPFINRHHFAGYMEMTLALPLGLLFTGAIEGEKKYIYIFAVAVMGIALIMTNSRGGIISLFAEVGFLALVSGLASRASQGQRSKSESKLKSPAIRVLLGSLLVAALLGGVVLLGGESALSRFVGTVNASDPTTGRTHFWGVALDVIKDHPLIGAGLGSFGLAYTRYDSRNGFLRLEQAHNDYLQILCDAGIIGAALGLMFIVVLFRGGFLRIKSHDPFRGGVALGGLAGCFAVLVHSLFDFTLHTTSNALLFLVFAALATLGSQVEVKSGRRHRRHISRGEAPPGAPMAVSDAGEVKQIESTVDEHSAESLSQNLDRTF